ncbi:MAG: glycosyltransferase family 4 protein [Solirubrobacterales bacterium]
MKALRIGVFSASLPRPGQKPGGVDVHIHRLANRLVGRGHCVRVASFSPSPADASYESVAMRPRGLGEHTLARLTLVSAAFNLLDTSDLDVVHLHGDDWFYLRRRGVPTVRTFHGSALLEARHATRARRRARQLACFALELAASRLATANYGLIPGDGTPYRVRGPLPIGVDPGGASDAARSPNPTVLFVGTWEGRKRGQMLHDAFQRHVRPLVPEARLQMVCEEPVRAGSEGVEWMGAPGEARLAELYRQAWVFCLPSSYEGFGLPYLEAMAQGAAVVATPNPGARHVLAEGRDGVLVDPAGLGEAITWLLLDKRARLNLARHGRERAQAFSWEAALDAHERAYVDAIERHRGWRRAPVQRGVLRRPIRSAKMDI